MRPRALSRMLVLSALLVTVLAVASIAPGVQRDPVEPTRPSDVRMVQPAPNGSEGLWPYTSRSRSFADATLPINVVVQSDPATVRLLLSSDGAAPGERLYWNPTAERWEGGQSTREAVTINATGVQWGRSPGAARYTFVRTGQDDQWTDATYQLHDGRYFGARYHLRLYEGGAGQYTWTAIQAHHEYWDWFRLRHSVDSLATARHHVERDFVGTGLLADIRRERYGNGGALDADGWATVIELRRMVTRGPKPGDPTPFRGVAAGIGLAVLAIGSTRVPEVVAMTHQSLRREARLIVRDLADLGIDRNHLALLVSTAVLPLLVRVGGITVERTFPGASPVVVGGPFYGLLVVGLPACAVLFGRGLPAPDAFGAAVLGMGTGIMADYAYLGISALPFGAIVQRVVLLFGLGLIAAGGTRWTENLLARQGYRIVGFGIWIGALLWPLLGLG